MMPHDSVNVGRCLVSMPCVPDVVDRSLRESHPRHTDIMCARMDILLVRLWRGCLRHSSSLHSDSVYVTLFGLQQRRTVRGKVNAFTLEMEISTNGSLVLHVYKVKFCRTKQSNCVPDGGLVTALGSYLAREVMIFCTIKSKPFALPWGRTPRLDSDVR
ncbi:hypothetical protein Tco_1356315, partial [Tanacetum coccineum]